MTNTNVYLILYNNNDNNNNNIIYSPTEPVKHI